jgi:hypothetical protein
MFKRLEMFMISIFILGVATQFGCSNPSSSQQEQLHNISHEAITKASKAASDFSICVALTARAYSNSKESASDIADASIAKCQGSLNDYEMQMSVYYGATVDLYNQNGPYARARQAANDLRAQTRQMAISQILDYRLKNTQNQ